MFISFDMIHERDRQTDRHHIPRLCIASRGNEWAVQVVAHFSKKSYEQPKFEFLIGLVHTKNHTCKFFSIKR